QFLLIFNNGLVVGIFKKQYIPFGFFLLGKTKGRQNDKKYSYEIKLHINICLKKPGTVYLFRHPFLIPIITLLFNLAASPSEIKLQYYLMGTLTVLPESIGIVIIGIPQEQAIGNLQSGQTAQGVIQSIGGP